MRTKVGLERGFRYILFIITIFVDLLDLGSGSKLLNKFLFLSFKFVKLVRKFFVLVEVNVRWIFTLREMSV